MILAALTLPLVQSAGVHEPPSVHYAVTPVPKPDRTELHVTLTFDGDEDGTTELELPRCRFGVPNIWESIGEVTAAGAECQNLDGMPRLRRLVHEPGAPVEVTYVLSFDPAAHSGYAYRPSVGNEHFHFFDSQWRARLVGDSARDEISLAFVDVPEGWTVFSNFASGPGPYRATAEALDGSIFIAGGDYHAATFQLGSKPVGVYLRGFQDPAAIAKRSRAIIEDLGAAFGDFEGEHYVVSISTRAGQNAGVAIRDAFVCLTDAGSTRLRLDVLVAHEFFHNWLPRSATVESARSGTALDEFRFDWFLEGFTEYVARRVLLEEGWITLDEYVSLFNRDLEEQAKNVERAASLEDVDAALRAGTYSNKHERTSYFRGPLMAQSGEVLLRDREEVDVLTVVRAFIDDARKSGGALAWNEFLDLLEGHGLPARAWYERHVVTGEPPTLAPDSFGPDFVTEPVTIVPVDPGFEVIGSRRAGRLQGVVDGGPAFEAGLRDGYELLEYKGSRGPDRPVRVRYRDEAGEHAVEFLPRGAPVTTVRFVRRRD